MYLLLESKRDAGTDAAFQQMQREFAGQVRFIKVDRYNQTGRDAAEQFSIESAPASVLLDAKGRVVEKIEGRINAADMRAKLNKLIGR